MYAIQESCATGTWTLFSSQQVAFVW